MMMDVQEEIWSCVMCSHNAFMIIFIFDITYWMIENKEKGRVLPKLYYTYEVSLYQSAHYFFYISVIHKPFHYESTIIY